MFLPNKTIHFICIFVMEKLIRVLTSFHKIQPFSGFFSLYFFCYSFIWMDNDYFNPNDFTHVCVFYSWMLCLLLLLMMWIRILRNLKKLLQWAKSLHVLQTVEGERECKNKLSFLTKKSYQHSVCVCLFMIMF